MRTVLKSINNLIFLSALVFTACGGGGGSDSPVTNDPAGDGSPDITAPAPGNNGNIIATSITSSSLVLNWDAASDTDTAQLNLVYAVYISSSNNINTPADCENNGTSIESFTTGLLTKTVNGLSADTIYYFNVVIRDSSGNKSCYTAKMVRTTLIADFIAPAPGGGGVISAGSVTSTSFILAWDSSADNVTAPLDIQYAVYRSTSDNINSAEDCENNGTRIKNYTPGLTHYTASGLSSGTAYYFNVVAKDSAGNVSSYNTKQFTTTETADTNAPVPGTGGTISAGSITHNSLIIVWDSATDDITAKPDIQYAVYLSTSDNVNTISGCEAFGTMIQNYTPDLTSKVAGGLAQDTVYYFNVIIKDSAGNKAIYSMKHAVTTIKPDSLAPVPGNYGTISATNITHGSLILNWSAGTDDITTHPGLQYAVYRSASDNISNLADCLANGIKIKDYTSGITSLAVNGLTPKTSYYFNIVVSDSADNRSVYIAKQVTTTPVLPTVSTAVIKNNLAFTPSIAGTSAMGGGNITDQGESVVVDRGLCWNETGSPTVNDSKVSDDVPAGTGIFDDCEITGLTEDRIYYVRAYAVSSSGTSYGNEVSFNSGKTFGRLYQGGYVFYNNGDGGGLVAAPSDQYSPYVSWSDWDSNTLATGLEIGTGSSNTAIIISRYNNIWAANATRGMLFGYNDWFLPSRNELRLMFSIRVVCGFGTKDYWSSSENNTYTAWRIHFTNNIINESTVGKTNSGNVRAIRAF